MKIGIVGLPNVGKSTLFQALTKKQVDIADYPFTTIQPNIGMVPVPDERFNQLVKLVKPERHFPAVIEIVDIAGLVKGAHKGEGLGNEFLSHIYAVDAIIFILGSFKEKHNPQEQLEILKEELMLKNKELAEKPSFVVCNGKSSAACNLAIDAKEELEANELSEAEIKELKLVSLLPALINQAYKTLNLITFYTIKGGKEIRAWAAPNRIQAPDAGGIVHSDFQEKFIRAEVIACEKLLEAGSWQQARSLGLIKTVGKDYAIQDSDIIEFKI